MTKILFWDTEWTPHVSYTWSNRPKFLPIEMLREDATMICFGARFAHQKRTLVVDSRVGYVEMLTQLRDILDEADMVVSYNGKSFDTKKVNWEFIRYNINPPSPYKEIDLYREIRRTATPYSGKLDFVSSRILDQKKVDTGGFQLWLDVMDGVSSAFNKMRKYQRQDVDLLVDLFEKLRPWIKFPHPVVEGWDTCRACGSLELTRRGFTTTLNGRYQRYVCDKCGSWSQGTARIPVTNMRNIAG